MSEVAFTPLEPARASSEAGGAKHPRRAARNVLVVDCHDSFVYNLVQLVREGGAVPHLVSCDEVPLDTIDHYDRVLLSPGPGLPGESGRLFDVVRRAAGLPGASRCSACVSATKPSPKSSAGSCDSWRRYITVLPPNAESWPTTACLPGSLDRLLWGVTIRGWSIATRCPRVWKSQRCLPTVRSWLCATAPLMCVACSSIPRAF